MNAHFKPVQKIDADQITFAAGVTDLNEVCALITCDAAQHDAIMLGGPVYGSFYRDLKMRTGYVRVCMIGLRLLLTSILLKHYPRVCTDWGCKSILACLCYSL